MFHGLTTVAHFTNISWCVHVQVFTASTIWRILRMRMAFVCITSTIDVRSGCSLTVMPKTFSSETETLLSPSLQENPANNQRSPWWLGLLERSDIEVRCCSNWMQ
jgi:hypothetical protein